MNKRLIMDQLKVPNNYFSLNEEEKIDVCVGLLEAMYEFITPLSHPNVSKIELMDRILKSTLNHHESIEEFETCQVLYDTQKLLDEHKDN